MTEKSLTMRSFGDALKSKMSKTVKKKLFDADKNNFESRPEALERDASKQEFLYELLFESLTYKLQRKEELKFPDLSKSWISGTINNKISLNAAILKAAQRKEAAKEVADYFNQNLIPNIPMNLLSVVTGNVSVLVQNDVTMGEPKKRSLELSFKKKSEADYLAEVWVLAVCMGAGTPKCNQNKTVKPKNTSIVEIPSLNTSKKPTPSIDVSSFFKSHVPAKEFIDRKAPRKLFYDILGSEPPYNQNVIMYYGIGGIGKSSLVKNLKEYTKEQGVLLSSVDFDDPSLRSPYKALISLENKIGTTFPHFDIAVTLCFIKRNPQFSFRDSGLPNALSRKVLELHHSSSNSALYNSTSGITELIYNEFSQYFALDESIKEQIAALEECSAADIEEQLPRFFAVDLFRHMAIEGINKCVLFFDTYELLWEVGRGEENKLRNDAWIRTMADMLKNVVFVLSGREKLQWELENKMWLDKIQLVPLDVLSPEYAKLYLSNCKIEDATIQISIINASKGHPYYLDLCVDTYYKLQNSSNEITPSCFDGGFHKIQERFFKSLAKNEVSVLRILSIPRFYDFEIFKMLTEQFQTGYAITEFDNFNSFSFIKHEPNSKYIIHILMRDEIKKHIKDELRKSIDNCMVSYYKEQLSPEKIPVDDIRFYFTELLHHLEAAESQEQVLSRLESEYISIVKRLQISGETNYLLEHFLNMFNTKRSLLGGTEFFAVMTDMIHLSGKYKEAVELITEYLSKFQINEIANDGYRLNLYIRRVHHQMFYVPLLTLQDDLKIIIDLVDQEKFTAQYCEMLFMLGAHIHLPMGNFEQADHYLQQVNRIAKDNGLTGLLCRGMRKYAEMHCANGQFDLAEQICTTGLKIATDHALWRYAVYLRCIIGEIKRLTGKTTDALVYFNEAMPIATSLGIKGWIGHINLALGNCYTDLFNFDLAFEHYEKARNTYLEIEQKWGELNLETAYQRAILISTGIADIEKLHQLKTSSEELGYNVLSKKIINLISGDKSIIRFEYL
ncbi:tetratricopeptide repeat protein [Bacteroides sp.]|uniref:tetratricopeptide repeat protein n=1 Tax=Bacteroides sp. TaxID=29523 RepID=UPI00263647C9|nr:tetratricopeptide repeat protein [Bacteroides sp.]MDD3040622.1 tetratricopeptide repeat protein [Bacteroides sp.]